MTNQQLFDRIARHLLEQGKSSHDGTRCVYRAADGSQCAVGCLISDTAYSPVLEGFSVYDAPVEHALEKSGIVDPPLKLLAELQYIHDVSDPDDWASRLKVIASDFGLQWNS